MTNEDKKYLIEKVGLCWHDWHSIEHKGIWRWECACSIRIAEDRFPPINLDPTKSSDMYDKIWPAFIKKSKNFMRFIIWLKQRKYPITLGMGGAIQITTSAPDLAQATLDYFKEKEKTNESESSEKT